MERSRNVTRIRPITIRTRIRGFGLLTGAFLFTRVTLAADSSQQTATPPIALAVACKAPCPELPAAVDDLRSFGLRTSLTRQRLDDRTSSAVGFEFALHHHQYATLGGLTSRLQEFAFIGGGTGGFEAGLGGDFAFGWRAAVAPEHGPFGRLGLRGRLLGNDLFYVSALELPTGQLGYQLLRERSLLIEIALSAAPVLVGRYNVEGAAPRRLGGSLAWGGHLAVFAGAAHLEASYARVEPEHDSRYGALDTLRAELCGTASVFALCGDLRYLRGDVHSLASDALAPARTWYLGAYVGLVGSSLRVATPGAHQGAQ